MMIDEIESISFFETELFMQTSLSSFKKLKNGHGQQDKNGMVFYATDSYITKLTEGFGKF